MSINRLVSITLVCLIALVSLGTVLVFAAGRPADAPSVLVLEILSSKDLNGTAGDFVTVKARITNRSGYPISDVTTYLSLVDAENKLPVDLEDWSVERGLYIGTIGPGQSFPLNWRIHFVKAGRFSLVVIADEGDSAVPVVSDITRFTVKPKRNLNPGMVLPVALGTPVLLVLLLFIVNVSRKKRR